MTEEQIKHMRDRFLFWKLPADFRPDCGIQFDADAARKINPINHRYEPVGTNLFDATQADGMVRFMVEGLPGVETATKTCGTCRFFDGPSGQCRRMCPVGSTIAQERLEQKAPWVAVWPIVQKTDWCGDYASNSPAT